MRLIEFLISVYTSVSLSFKDLFALLVLQFGHSI